MASPSIASLVYNYLDSPLLVVKFQTLCGVEWKPNVNQEAYKNTNTIHAKVSTTNCQNNSRGGDLSLNNPVGVNEVDYIIKNKFLYYLFHFATALGSEVFYITFFPVLAWNMDSYVARRVLIFWALSMYFAQVTKDILKWPRPISPPVIRLEDRYSLEYGMPSSHAMMGAALPFSILLLTKQRYVYPLEYGLIVCITWTTLVCLSRLYLGVHSVLDIVGGLAYIIWLLFLCFPWLDTIDYFILHSDYSPLATVFIPLLMCICYPRLDRWSPARGDTTTVLGVASGVSLGMYFAFQHGYLHYAKTSPPYVIMYPGWNWAWKLVTQIIIGTPILILTRGIVKLATLSIVTKMLNLDQNNPLHRQKLSVELPYKYLTYAAVAFIAAYVAPLIFRYLNIERKSFFTEI